MEALSLDTHDSSKVPGKVSIVPDNSDRNWENKSFNLSSMSSGASLTNSLLMFFRKYSLRDSSDTSSREGSELLVTEGSWGEVEAGVFLWFSGCSGFLCS
jgi:hypothetical protein